MAKTILPTCRLELSHNPGEADVVITLKCHDGAYAAAVLYDHLVDELKRGGATLQLANLMGGQEA